MSRFTKEYIETTYTPVTLLSEGQRSKVEIVKNRAGLLAVKKTSCGGNQVYDRLKELHHQGLAKILITVISEQETIVIEEYVSGETLQHKLDQRIAVDWPIIHNWMMQLAEVLVFIHSHNIIHRDIKPSNIIISADGVVKLIDFDSSRSFRQEQSNDTVYLGTRGYAAPEQYGYAQTDARSDIYSFGVLYNQLFSSGMVGTAPPPRIQQMIATCTQMDPVNRYQSAAALLEALRPNQKAAPLKARRKKAKIRPESRRASLLMPRRIWRLIVLLLYSALIIYSGITADNNPAVNRQFIFWGYIWLFITPLLYPLDILALRTIPLIPLFRKEHHPILYGLIYYLGWFFLTIAYFVILTILDQ